MVDNIENFFGVYLLYCTNPQFKGRTYIGFTVDPNRRIKQHNTGKHAGGAKRTHGRGPWDMVMIVHGFPNQISALRFEWAWQNPNKSRRLRHVVGKRKNETPYKFKIRVVCEMLRANPWARLALTWRWLIQSYIVELDANCLPPAHMPTAYGPVKPKKVTSSESDSSEISKHRKCTLCQQQIENSDENILKCLQKNCAMTSHVLCLANCFLREEMNSKPKTSPPPFIPVEGSCPSCSFTLLWGDLIRAKNGCYQNITEEGEDGDHWADELHTQLTDPF